jgi:hypothetical protein
LSDIFISYSNADRNQARILANALEHEGWSVWWDRKIPPGKTFDEVIDQAIQVAKCVIVLWSKESAKSDWVKAEATEGKSRGILIPAMIDDDVRIPLEFRYLQASRLTDWIGQADHPEFESMKAVIVQLLSDASLHQTDKTLSATGTAPASWFQTNGVKREASARADLNNERLTLKQRRFSKTKPFQLVMVGLVIAALLMTAGLLRLFQRKAPANAIVNDPVTALIWTRDDDNGKGINWSEAEEYCRNLRLGGYSGWQLPTIDELAKLYDPEGGNNNIRKPFRLTGWLAWSSTKKDPDSAWGFFFNSGARDSFSIVFSSYGSRALCVRPSGK